MPVVTVACKVPNGLLLRIGNWQDYNVSDRFGGTRAEKIWVPVGEPVKINGPARGFGEPPRHPEQDGFALTHGVDADFFAKWMHDNADLDVVKHGLIKAHEKPMELKAQTREAAHVKSGMEPLELDGGQMVDKRIPRRVVKTERIGEMGR